MISDWKKEKWGNICSLEYGKGIRNYKSLDQKYPVYGSSGFIGTYSKYLSDTGGVIVSRKGTLTTHYSEEPFFVIDTAYWLKANKEILNQKWAYYAILNFKIKKLKTGTGLPSLSRDDFYDTAIYLPSIPEQKKIFSILEKIDKKIKINETKNSEQIKLLKIFFDFWFVQYDYPNINQKPYKTSKGILNKKNILKRSIPSGWKIKKLKDILISLETGNRPVGGIKTIDGGIPSIGAENIISLGKYNFHNEKFVSKDYFQKLNQGIIKSNDVLLYKDGAGLGKSSMFKNNFPHKTCCINSHVFILRSNEEITQNYLYLWLQQDFIKKMIFKIGVKAAQPGINQEDVEDIPILVPDAELLLKFEKISNPIIDNVFANAKENKDLTLFRDWLLPMLMNGQIKIN